MSENSGNARQWRMASIRQAIAKCMGQTAAAGVAGLILAPALSATAEHAAPTAPVVAIQSGKGSGAAEGNALVWRNIPFASAQRWEAPTAAPTWQGMRDGTTPGPICPQKAEGDARNFAQSEDCLNLNVWAPAAKGGKPLPVMVWIHGGSFRVGSGSLPLYDGQQIVSRGVVLVTINDRLGLLGRFAHPDLSKQQAGAPRANYGLMDQVAALQWVQRNIHAFGGDPANVTIFGYSAGGVSVNYLMAAPGAFGLFHKAIAQSGGIQIETTRHISEQRPGLLGKPLESEGLATAKNFGTEGQPLSLAGLRQVPAADLVAYQEKTLMGSLNPVVDGVLIPDDIGRTFRDGKQARVPYMAGSTSWEASLISYTTPKLPPRAVLSGIDDLDGARKAFGGLDDPAMADAWFADSVFLGTAHYLSRAQAKAGQPSFLYLFDHVPAAIRGTVPGAAHGDEVPFIFGTLPNKIRGLTADKVSAEDRRVSAMMTDYWTRFAKAGDLSPTGWPPLARQTATGTSINMLDADPRVVTKFKVKEMDYLDGYYAKRIDLSK